MSMQNSSRSSFSGGFGGGSSRRTSLHKEHSCYSTHKLVSLHTMINITTNRTVVPLSVTVCLTRSRPTSSIPGTVGTSAALQLPARHQWSHESRTMVSMALSIAKGRLHTSFSLCSTTSVSLWPLWRGYRVCSCSFTTHSKRTEKSVILETILHPPPTHPPPTTKESAL